LVFAEPFDDYPGGGLYLVSETIQFQRNGQRLLGQGYGEASAGSQPYTLAASTNSVTLTYTGTQTVNAFISGSGVAG
jgi:hypothetical protein